MSAGAIGKYDQTTHGQVINIGGGSNAAGVTGSANVTINYTPIWTGGS